MAESQTTGEILIDELPNQLVKSDALPMETAPKNAETLMYKLPNQLVKSDELPMETAPKNAETLMDKLPNQLVKSLAKMGYKEFTEIQKRAIPVALEGKDILGSAQTGTGKTAAFALPIAAALIQNPESLALIITPTRELAQQVHKIFMQILEFTSIRCSLLIGGDSMGLQINQLKYNPRVIIGTPGRINDHLERRTLKLANTKFLVLDETDRMLDMGFGIQINNIIPHLADERQTLLFSATISSTIEKLASQYLTNPERIAVGAKNSIVANIEQEVVHLKEKEKFDRLLVELTNRQGSIIVFVRTKYSADKISEKLRGLDHNSCSIHGDLRQNKRERVMHRFRTKKHRILVGTDVVARGIDIDHVEHVINYDLTQAPEDFIHRLGRTARGEGAKGYAVSFVSEVEQSQWRDIQRLLDPNSAKDYSDRRGSNSKGRSERRGSRPGNRNGNTMGARDFDRRAPRNRNGETSRGSSNRDDTRFPREQNRDANSFSRDNRENTRFPREQNRDGNSFSRDKRENTRFPREQNRDGNSFSRDNRENTRFPREQNRDANSFSRDNRENTRFPRDHNESKERFGNQSNKPRNDFSGNNRNSSARKGGSANFSNPASKSYFKKRK